MKIRLPLSFSAASPDWEPHCQALLRLLNDDSALLKDATLQLNGDIAELRHPSYHTPVYFSVSESVGLEQMGAVTRCLLAGGEAGLQTYLVPHIGTSTTLSGKLLCFLGAKLVIPDSLGGLYRACLRILESADRLPPEQRDYLLALGKALEDG